jgi:ABC-type transport system substrate-binding protein
MPAGNDSNTTVVTDRTGKRVTVTGGDWFPTTRREFVAMAGTGGSALLAGCDSDQGDAGDTATAGDDTTGADDEPEMVDQTLYLPLNTNPENITFLNTGFAPSTALVGDGWDFPQALEALVHEEGMWGPWSNGVLRHGEPMLGLYESFEVTADECTMVIKDDATWSNGDDVLGRDAVTELAAFRMFFNLTPIDEVDEKGVNIAADAITDFEWSGKEATLISEGNHFGDLIEEDLWMFLLTRWREWGGFGQNTRIEPYDRWHERIFELWENTKAGDADPWSMEPFVIHAAMEVIDTETADVAIQQRDPENVATCGAWTLEEIRGDAEVVLTKNEHHRHADEINFENVVFRYREDERANWAALNTRNLDVWDGDIPDNVVESFGPHIDRRMVPTQGGISYHVDHDAELFSTPHRRRGFYYAIDKAEVAAVESEARFDPITTPGADVWDADDHLDEDLLDAFRTYDHDPERATELWEDAGFTKEDGQWFLPSGDRAELVVPTDETSPSKEIALVSQLNDFGIAAELRTFDSAVYEDRLTAGEFDIYNSVEGRSVGYGLYGIARAWPYQVAQWVWVAKMSHMFPEAQVQATDYRGEEGDYGIIAETTPEAFSEYTIEAPAVGEWDGSLREWEAPRMGWEVFQPVGEDMNSEYVPQLAWLTNWWLPSIPIANEYNQILLQADHWQWPAEDAPEWEPVGVSRVTPNHMLARGDTLSANPENPRSG